MPIQAVCAGAPHNSTLELMHAKVSRPTKMAFLSALLLGAVVGIAMFFAAGDHNPQQAFHGAPWSSPLHWALVGISWFAATFALTFPVLWIVLRFLVRGPA